MCYSHQACCFLYYLREINSGIHMYQFTFKLFTLLFPDVVVVSDFNKNSGGSRISRKKGTDRRIYISLFTPLKPGTNEKETPQVNQV